MSTLEKNSLAFEFGIPAQILNQAASAAYAFILTYDLDNAIGMARGLVAADATNWYFRELLGTALFRNGNRTEALEVIEEGLAYAPESAKLVDLRLEIRSSAANAEEASLASGPRNRPDGESREGTGASWRFMTLRG
jgi:hypothetical protein